MSLKTRYFINISYRGTHYHGWQIQPNENSVQETIEKALSVLLRDEITVVGCGRTDSGVHASQFFLHFDIKQAIDKELNNVVYIRTFIEMIDSFFDSNEISEIWFTFPDPQLKKNRIEKRLTSPVFIDLYRKFLKADALVHLKTDNEVMYEYTLDIAQQNNFKIITSTKDLYAEHDDETLSIKTYYELKYLKEGLKICYLQFRYNGK